MTKVIILLFFWSFTFTLSAQKVNDPQALNTCSGAVNIFKNDQYQLQFTGKKSSQNLSAYPSLSDVAPDNQIWCSFIASESGELSFNASKKTGFVQMVIFTQELDGVCHEIDNGKAEIKRMYLKKDMSTVGLDYEVGDGFLYALEMKKGQKIQVLFTAEAGTNDKLYLDWLFTPFVNSEVETRVVDKRVDDFAPTFTIKIRDKETNQPLIASVSIEGSKNIDALYTGSDLLFNIERSCKLTIKCAVEGYFFNDLIETVSEFEDMELVIPLEVVSSGKSMIIEDIEFTAGTSEITKASEPRLERLKDFLALNSNLTVEIQGHVFALGDNSYAGQRISEARAKRVMKFLIDNGIDRNRLSAVGYGNTRPIYAKPQFSYEEQANRRVEIKVL